MKAGSRNAFAVVLVAAIGVHVGAGASEALARSRGGSTGNANSRVSRTPPANTAAIDAARGQVAAAQADVNAAQAAVDKVTEPLKAASESSAEMKAALAELRDAQTARESADKAVAARLREDPAYQAAAARKKAAETRLDALRDSPDGSSERITAGATEVMDAAGTVTRLESAAEGADPQAVQARAALVAADAKVAQLRKQFDDSVRTDPQWLAAKKALDDAQKKLATAEAALQAAQAK